MHELFTIFNVSMWWRCDGKFRFWGVFGHLNTPLPAGPTPSLGRAWDRRQTWPWPALTWASRLLWPMAHGLAAPSTALLGRRVKPKQSRARPRPGRRFGTGWPATMQWRAQSPASSPGCHTADKKKPKLMLQMSVYFLITWLNLDKFNFN